MSRKGESASASGQSRQSPSTRPEIDLSSKNVFAFGLQSSYGGFSNEEQRRRFPQLARNGTAVEQPRGAYRVSWSTVARRGVGDHMSSKHHSQKKRAPVRAHISSGKGEKDREAFYDHASRSETGGSSRSRSPSPSVRSSQMARTYRVAEPDSHGDPPPESQSEMYDSQDQDQDQDQDQNTENRLSPGSKSPLIILEHTPSHHDHEQVDGGEVSQSEYLSLQSQVVGSSGSTSDRGPIYGSGHFYDRHLAVGSSSGHNHSGSRIRVDPHAPHSHHVHSDGFSMVQGMEHLTISDMPSPHGGSSTSLSGGSRPLSGRGHSPPQSPSHAHLLPIHADYGHYYYQTETPTTPTATHSQQYMRMPGFSGLSSLPQMHVAPPIVGSIAPIPVSYLTGMPGSGRNLNSICRFYAQGHCARGEQCNYAHVSSPKGGSRPTHSHQEGEDLNCPTCRAQQKGGAPSYPKSKGGDRHKTKGNRYVQQHKKGGGRFPQGPVHVHSHPSPAYPSPHSSHSHPLPFQEGVSPHSQQHPLPVHSVHSLAPPPRHSGHRGAPVSGPVSKFSANSSIEQLEGNIYVIAKDQYGCRLLQRMLDERKAKVVDITFREVFEHINELMTDPFGNYLCQKLIEHCTDPHRLAIIQKVSPDLVAISLNMHGTRAVQKLVETISTPKEVELVVGALRQSVVTLIKDLNGNHVIQRCLHHLSSKDNQFIFDAVARHCVSVATHKHGCCVLQRCIDYATVTQKRQLVQEIVSNALELVQDAFGNYVVQYVLDLGEPPLSHGIMSNLLGNISSLSVQKFSSNVVEKCMELADDEMRGRLVEELVNVERLPRLLQDPYANYVIQKALQVSKKAQFERLVAVIKPHLSALRNTSFGKRIQSKIMKKFPDLSPVLDHSVHRSSHQAHPHSPPPMHSIISHSPHLSHQPQGSGALLVGAENHSHSRDSRSYGITSSSSSKVSSEFQQMPLEREDSRESPPERDSTNPDRSSGSRSSAVPSDVSPDQKLTEASSKTSLPSEGDIDSSTASLPSKDSLRSSSSSASWLWSQSSDQSTHSTSPSPNGLL